ncbi:hypothetical protein KFU94_68920 [Chloroflexi bacterium TSY]|nr:hypothetical protein [Chloroflexi bacterium TSY]
MGLFDRLQSELEAREKAGGLTMADVLALPDEQSKLVSWLINQKEASLTDVANYLGMPEPDAQHTMNALIDKSFVREMKVEGVVRYKIRFTRKRGRKLPLNIWEMLDDQFEE